MSGVADEVDEAKEAHDREVVRSVRQQAIATAKAADITMTLLQEREALGMFPKIAGLARKLHDNATLQEKFEKIVVFKRGEDTHKRRLDRRVPTRWNSDFACLSAHLFFKDEVKIFTTSENKMSDYALTELQWGLAEHLVPVLELFNDLTNVFSQAEVPLIYKVVPMLESLEHALDRVYNANDGSPPVVRIAAKAALQVVGKYYALTDDNEVYRIAIGEC
ncbi:hypothetical protein BDR05DRAFT_897048 [Suillus weaverae]|nr:hypothetical protein BDR05DRAFT_897048 [Suillus weaverae]